MMKEPSVDQPITGYHTDEEGHWVAWLACGHNQHVRHDPPLVRRNWVLNAQGRQSMLGHSLGCKKCVEHAPADDRPLNSSLLPTPAEETR